MKRDRLQKGVVPLRPGQFLRLVMSGAIGAHGYLEASRVYRSKLIDSQAAAAMEMSLAQGQGAIGSFWVEYATGECGCGAIRSEFWPGSLRSLVDRPAGAPVVFGHWRDNVPGFGSATLMAVDVPEEMHREVSRGRGADFAALFATLPMSERLEVVDESLSTSQRTLTVYFDGRRAEVVDNSRPWPDYPHPTLGFAGKTIEQACSELKTWFVQRNLRFTSGRPLDHFRFDCARASLSMSENLRAQARASMQVRQELLERCQGEDSLIGTPALLRQRQGC